MDEITVQSKQRDSNLELFRIITMFLIVAHHYVVNSGLMDLNGPIQNNPLCAKSIFLSFFGAWGKTGINCFVFITGYFMCKSQITVKKFMKLLAQVYFYKIIIYLIFLISGYSQFNLKNFVKMILPISSVSSNFTGCFLIFYLLIPYLNIAIKNMDEKTHFRLATTLVVVYVFIGSIPSINIVFNYVTWFCTLYIISSYVRLYDKPIFNRVKLWLLIMIISIMLACLSVVSLLYIGSKVEKFVPYFFLSDSNKILAVTTSFSAFMFFKNLKIKYNKFINMIAASSFGVLLIHANSDTMRQWLWRDLLNNVNVYETEYIYSCNSICILYLYNLYNHRRCKKNFI